MNAKRRLLVVDDDPVVRRLLSEVLTAVGYEVTPAGDGRSALETARRESFDLVLLDHTLPDLTGFDVLAELRGRAETRTTPVLMLSGDDRETLEARGGHDGCQGYLEKPFSGRTLLTAVRALAG